MAGNNLNHAGFERTDVNVFAVGKFAIALLLVTLCVLALIFGVFRYFQSLEGGEAVSVDPTKVFPQPQLEKAEVPALDAVRAAEEQVLNSYAVIDAKKGIARIPIARAMDLLAQRGLPARPAPPQAGSTSVPTESGLGAEMMAPGGPLAGGAK